MAISKEGAEPVPVRTIRPSGQVQVSRTPKYAQTSFRTRVGTSLSPVTPGMGGNIYSPELSTDFLELPQTDSERRAYFNFFYNNDPVVGQAIDILSQMPLSKVRLKKPRAKNRDVAIAAMEFCTDWVQRNHLLQFLMQISHGWNLEGEVHVFLEDANPDPPEDVQYEVVGEISPEGEIRRTLRLREDAQRRLAEWTRKNYMGWTSLQVLPADQIQIETFPFTTEQIVHLIPDHKTKSVVDRANSGDTHAMRVLLSMPADVVDALRDGSGIPLNTDPSAGSYYYYLGRRVSATEQRGKSILQRCLRTLVFRDKVRQSLTSIASRHMTPYRVVTADDLNEVQLDSLRSQVDLALMDPDFTIVANYQINWDERGADQRLPDWSWVFEFTDRQLYAGLGVTESLLSGESSYSGDRINLEVINQRFMNLREVLKEFVEEQVFRPMCARMGFIEDDSFGRPRVIVPELSFTRLSFRDNTETFDALLNLYQKGSLDVGTILEHLNMDPVEVKEKLEADFGTLNDATFNELLRGMYSRTGDSLAENSDFVKKVAKRLGLAYQKAEEGGGRF